VKQHPFDPLAFVFGLLFLGAGLPLLFSESGFAVFEGRWILPTFLIVAGAAMLATTRKRIAMRESVMSDTGTEDDFDSVVR
jgi:hypothetical protein